MKTVERNVVRLAVVQHLRATYGIKIKNWNKSKTSSSSKLTAGNSIKVFGVALESLPHCHVLDYGDIPCFLVDACTCLMSHLDTEGLFRKSGSIVRVKAIRAKLDQAEECLSTALPLDIAGLLKQFFRELPEPILPTDLQSAFLKAQELPTSEERTSAIILLSCVLPHGNVNILRYFFSFLNRVSQRCGENKMDSGNLSVIFAPNLLHCGDGTEKMSTSTEKKLKLQAAVVQCLIDNAEDLGVVPEFLIAKVPAMLGCESGVFSPADAAEDGNTPSGVKRCRRSFGDVVNGALSILKTSRTPSRTPQSDGAVFSTDTPVIITPKRKLPMESGQSYGFSNKKRRSLKKNLGLELFPNPLFGGGSTPGSVHSASGTLDSSRSGISSVGRISRLSASSSRRRSKRLSHRNVNRVESGKAGCFSPRVTKKEATRKSLRLRFSLGKPSRDCSVLSHSQPVPKGSEAIGWRLATQESVTTFHFTKDAAFSPAVLRNGTSTGSKYISKSEDNLLTPCPSMEPGTSFCRKETPDSGTQIYTGSSFSDTPMSSCLKSAYRSEPIIVVTKPPTVGNLPKSLCCATSSESLASSESCTEEQRFHTGPTLLRIKGDVDESVGVFHTSDGDQTEEEPKEKVDENANDTVASSEPCVPLENTPISTVRKTQRLADDPDVTFGQIEIVPLSPLHIDSALFETYEAGSSASLKNTSVESVEQESSSLIQDNSTSSENCSSSRLIDALDIQSPVVFRLNSSITVQSTPFTAREQIRELNSSQIPEFKEPSLAETSESSSEDKPQEPPPLCPAQIRHMKVADHIQRFNMMTLKSPKNRASRSPLKFQRTPVRQSVRRINSLLGQRKENRSGWCATSRGPSVMKSLSLECGLSTGATTQQSKVHDQDQNQGIVASSGQNVVKDVVDEAVAAAVHQKLMTPNKSTVRHCALGDVTNTMAKAQPRAKADAHHTKSAQAEFPKPLLLQTSDRDTSHYRGSPRNPLTQGKLLSATKPVDL
ncbi:rho GTPase-activating protein 11A isoform X1 [Astyanax mexicanus]|uniref:rho GTPase-activating protein 11A isoform X1 n=1 Tax=Astyanax mexicanus TaxID=7994 RepID=UPI0020CB2879|nr:rho GTPase-activating protein 11A isoform X1 [Astyanax mexicanus]